MAILDFNVHWDCLHDFDASLENDFKARTLRDIVFVWANNSSWNLLDHNHRNIFIAFPDSLHHSPWNSTKKIAVWGQRKQWSLIGINNILLEQVFWDFPYCFLDFPLATVYANAHRELRMWAIIWDRWGLRFKDKANSYLF